MLGRQVTNGSLGQRREVVEGREPAHVRRFVANHAAVYFDPGVCEELFLLLEDTHPHDRPPGTRAPNEALQRHRTHQARGPEHPKASNPIHGDCEPRQPHAVPRVVGMTSSPHRPQQLTLRTPANGPQRREQKPLRYHEVGGLLERQVQYPVRPVHRPGERHRAGHAGVTTS